MLLLKLEFFIESAEIVQLEVLLIAIGWSAPEIVQLVNDEPFEFMVMPLYGDDCVKLNLTPLALTAPLTTRLAPAGKLSTAPEFIVSVTPELTVNVPAKL